MISDRIAGRMGGFALHIVCPYSCYHKGMVCGAKRYFLKPVGVCHRNITQICWVLLSEKKLSPVYIVVSKGVLGRGGV